MINTMTNTVVTTATREIPTSRHRPLTVIGVGS